VLLFLVAVVVLVLVLAVLVLVLVVLVVLVLMVVLVWVLVVLLAGGASGGGAGSVCLRVPAFAGASATSDVRAAPRGPSGAPDLGQLPRHAAHCARCVEEDVIVAA
jgi:hypothetical protein